MYGKVGTPIRQCRYLSVEKWYFCSDHSGLLFGCKTGWPSRLNSLQSLPEFSPIILISLVSVDGSPLTDRSCHAVPPCAPKWSNSSLGLNGYSSIWIDFVKLGKLFRWLFPSKLFSKLEINCKSFMFSLIWAFLIATSFFSFLFSFMFLWFSVVKHLYIYACRNLWSWDSCYLQKS